MKKMLSAILIISLCFISFCGCEFKKCEHNYVLSSEIQPTCKAPGSKTFKCTLCDKTYSKDIPNDDIPHDWNNGIPEEFASCTQAGIKLYMCQQCTQLKREEYYSDHIPLTNFGKKPTCQSEGKTDGSYCYTCGKILKEQETLKKVDHDLNTNGKCSMCYKSFYSVKYNYFSNTLYEGENIIKRADVKDAVEYSKYSN